MKFTTIQFYLYYFFLTSIYLIYILSILNLYQTPNDYVHLIHNGFRLIIGIILMITYNPIIPFEEIQKHHHRIAFSAGFYMIFDFVNSYYRNYYTSLFI